MARLRRIFDAHAGSSAALRRPARENLAAAGGVGDAGDVVGPDDAEVLDVRQRGDADRDADLRVGQRVIDRRDQIVDRTFEALDERRGHAVLAGLDVNGRRLERQTRRGLGHARIDVEQRLALTVDGNLDLLALVRPAEQHAAGVAVQFDLEHVVAVGREVVRRRHAAARAERRALDAAQLRRRLRHAIVGLAGRRLGIANRERGHPGGGAQVAFEQRRRKRLRVGDVIEAVADRVCGQQRGDVDVDGEHVFHRARVFGAIETLERPRPGIRIGRRGAIDAALERRCERVELRRLRTPGARGRHHAGAQLANHLLGDVEMVGGLGGVEGCERELTGLRAIVVAA